MLKSRLPAIAASLSDRVDGALRVGAESIAEEAQSRVVVDTGRLRDKIHVEREGIGEYAVVAGDEETFYGHLVEHGTTNTPARPFLIPAGEARRETVVAGVAAALRSI